MVLTYNTNSSKHVSRIDPKMSSILDQMGSLQGPLRVSLGGPWGLLGGSLGGSLGVSWGLPGGSLEVPGGSLVGPWEVPGDPGRMFGCQDGSQIAFMPHLGANLGPGRANMDPTWSQLGSKIDLKRATHFNKIFD